MNSCITFILLSLLLLVLNLNLSLASSPDLTDDTDASISRYSSYVKNACNVTRYKSLCIRTLWPFAVVAKNNSSIWARAGVAVTITDTKQVLRLLLRTRDSKVGKREKIALADCRELFVDSLDSLYKSLAVLRKINVDEFQRQISDLQTWESAALTDQDTCSDGMKETSSVDDSSSMVRKIQRKVTKCMQLCSNALALLNKLAYDGL